MICCVYPVPMMFASQNHLGDMLLYDFYGCAMMSRVDDPVSGHLDDER